MFGETSLPQVFTGKYPTRVKSVAEWLHHLNLNQYAVAFRRSAPRVSVATLPTLTEETLKSIGVVHPGHRKRMLIAVKCLDDNGSTTIYPSTVHSSDAAVNLTEDSPDDTSDSGNAASNHDVEEVMAEQAEKAVVAVVMAVIMVVAAATCTLASRPHSSPGTSRLGAQCAQAR